MIEKKQIQTLYWDKECTVGEIADKLNLSFWTLYNFMEKYGISRRGHSEAGHNYNRIKPQFEIKSHLSFSEEKLKIAGIMLYWAEGTLRGKTVDFANSNDTKLLAQIDLWIREYINNINIWAGTQVAKGGRLCKRSVLPKGEMEK